MAFHKPSAAAMLRMVEKAHAERVGRSNSIAERLIESYKAEPDREYAEEFYGSMLRERGIDPASLTE